MIKVLPSSNPCPEKELLEYSKDIMKLGVEYLHCDVMDGNFVENKCLDLETLREVRNNCNILLDVHLMTEDIYRTIQRYGELKPNIITFHYESPTSIAQMNKCIKYIKSKDILVGMSIKPSTPVEMLEPYLDIIDLVLIMSVEPGKSGQKFILDSLDKIKNLKSLTKDKNIIIEVDGGINLDNYSQVVEAGADFIVMGSAFYNAKDRKKLLTTIDNHY